MGHSILVFLITIITQLSYAKTEPTIEVGLEDYLRQQQQQQGGCFSNLFNGVSQNMSATLEAQTNETNTLIALSQQYYEHEQTCGNKLAEPVMELNNMKAEHEANTAKLPLLIKKQQLEYERAAMAIQQECEASSGETFLEWKSMKSKGVITPERGGPMALFSRGQNINKFRKLFEQECLASASNVKRFDNLATELALNIEMLELDVQNSARKLASLSENLSFKQGQTVKNCVDGKKQLDYQRRLSQNNAKATNTLAKRNNYLNMMNSVAGCVGGPLSQQMLKKNQEGSQTNQ